MIMKQTTQIFKSIIAVAAVTICVACKKEIERPQNDLNGSYKVKPNVQVINSSTLAKTKPIGYIGQGTLGDSTKAGY